MLVSELKNFLNQYAPDEELETTIAVYSQQNLDGWAFALPKRCDTSIDILYEKGGKIIIDIPSIKI